MLSQHLKPLLYYSSALEHCVSIEMHGSTLRLKLPFQDEVGKENSTGTIQSKKWIYRRGLGEKFYKYQRWVCRWQEAVVREIIVRKFALTQYTYHKNALMHWCNAVRFRHFEEECCRQKKHKARFMHCSGAILLSRQENCSDFSVTSNADLPETPYVAIIRTMRRQLVWWSYDEIYQLQ